MQTESLLVIDDEPMNISLLQTDLEGAGYHVITADNGEQGWELLQQNKGAIHAILLDRMMPGMNGIELLGRIKSSDEHCDIPVIMQTASAQAQEVAEGIDAGAYYYLTKPYDYQIMLSIVNSAVGDYKKQQQLKSDIRQFTSKVRLIKNSSFEFQTLEEANHLTTFIANFYPDPEGVIFGISELLVNAVEHGNLGITYDEKTELITQDKWLAEVNNRLEDPIHAEKKVRVDFSRSDTEISLRIEDEGKGFDWQRYLDLSPSRAHHSHGRGIAMSKMMSFDFLEYEGSGNIVIARVMMNK